MGEVLHEADVAEILKVPETTVRRLFEDAVLTGSQTDDVWQTTPEILEADLEILVEGERVERLRQGVRHSPWEDAARDDATDALAPERVAEVLKQLGSA